MKEYHALTGTVSHLNKTTEVRGGGDYVGSSTYMSFRIDGTPVITTLIISLADGDVVSVAGSADKAELFVQALHNHTTNYTYRPELHRWYLIVPIVLIVIGLPLLMVLFGIIPLLLGFHYLSKYNRLRTVIDLLDEELAKGPPATVKG